MARKGREIAPGLRGTGLLALRPGEGATRGWTSGSSRVDELSPLPRDGHGEGFSLPEAAPVKLFSSRWSNRALETAPVVAVGISRGVPRFRVAYRYRRLLDLYPDGWMFSIEDDERFERVYVAKLERLGVDRIMEGLRKISDEEGGADLVLLCFEDVLAGESCHRRMFAAWWTAQTGQVVEELSAVGSHHRRDAQERLF